MGKLLKSISIRRLANRDLHEEDRQQIKDLLFILERLMLELIGNWQYFVMGYHEHIWFRNAGKILTVYIILKEFWEKSLADILV